MLYCILCISFYAVVGNIVLLVVYYYYYYLYLECCVSSQHCVLQLNNRLFEELAMDVYDEVDRRENETSKVASLHDASHQLIAMISIL